MEGWISLYRKIQEHWLWTKKRKFSQFEAWISLLFKANHKDIKLMFDGKIIEVQKGSFITSEVKLSEEWNWSRDTVRKFLKTLESEKMIRKISTTKYTTISIENWEVYQFPQHQNKQQNIQVIDSTLDTNNNDNNDNNILFILFNKYMSNFSFMQTAEEKQKIFKETCMQDEQFKELTQEQQTQLYTKLLSKM